MVEAMQDRELLLFRSFPDAARNGWKGASPFGAKLIPSRRTPPSPPDHNPMLQQQITPSQLNMIAVGGWSQDFCSSSFCPSRSSSQLTLRGLLVLQEVSEPDSLSELVKVS